MGLTSDPSDPRLTHGADDEPTGQAEVYLVLSDAERAKGFVRPVRHIYIHVGVDGHEVDPFNPRRHGRTGNACGRSTRMGQALAETYARQPDFYGATYCVGCRKHLPVGPNGEFVWEDGSKVGT